MHLKKRNLTNALLLASLSSLTLFNSCESSSGKTSSAISSGANASANADAKNLKGGTSTSAQPAEDPEDKIPYQPITIDTAGKWVVKGPKPKENAILPNYRIVAYYGNLYSKKMGILGELPPKEMLAKLNGEAKKWAAADPSTPVKPALHLIVVTAQGQPGKAGKYRLRMPFKMIDSVLVMAKSINAEVFLDVQVGLGTLQEELPPLEQYLKLPNVHLGIDPEFSMKSGHAPGKRIGTFDAADINYASDFLTNLVRTNNLPPKMLIVHRFTRKMVTNSQNIKLNRDIQIVMHMDGWGPATLKRDTYRSYIYKEPVQYTGFKLFYKNDIKCGKPIMEPSDVLALYPKPIYIQYQ
ncbi:hypothetical protein [Solitalea lacus]|uniref:hypothetical protein n=1 Tax=Solitalea lacus TaxID=2911172 RepID=UPI001ED9CA7E|nr:hypothetical protein [Solitalea lacus]UKJ06918.1 hypothetical protein L2B55_15465 [Solitalea lacus]